MRFLTAGESHGPCLVGIVEGFPAGFRVDIEAINRDLARRQQGYGRGGRMQIERDEVQILTGLGTALPSAVPLLYRSSTETMPTGRNESINPDPPPPRTC